MSIMIKLGDEYIPEMPVNIQFNNFLTWHLLSKIIKLKSKTCI